MQLRSTGFRSFLPLVITAALMLWSGCSLLQPLQEQKFGELGRFEFRYPDKDRNGVMVGVPHGTAESVAVEYGSTIRKTLGAGLVIAYDFGSKRIPVDRPMVYQSEITAAQGWSAYRINVYREFGKLLRQVANQNLKFYVGVRLRDEATALNRIEVVTGGLSFEQINALKETYIGLRNRAVESSIAPKVDIAISPLEILTADSSGVKNHGVLLLAERGLILRLPKFLILPEVKAVYEPLLAAWVKEAASIVLRNPARLKTTTIEMMPWGRIDSISSRKKIAGAVIAAPHGSFDWYTDELAEEVSFHTGLAAVITRGFTPTECGGWRIDVNRPTERRYLGHIIERETPRAREVFRRYAATVLRVAGGPLDLYIDLHQNSVVDEIDVATIGISVEQALKIKRSYRKIRDRVLQQAPDVSKVQLVLEPIDKVSIGAWAAKSGGILGMAKSSLHFELPAHQVFYREKTRRAYKQIITELIQDVVHSWQGPEPLS